MFRARALLLIVIASSACASLSKAAPPDADKKSLQGTWKLTAVRVNGRDMPPEFIQMHAATLVIDGDKWTETIKNHENEPIRNSMKLDASKSPKQIDLTELEPEAGKAPEKHLGLYSVDEKTFSLCIKRKGDERPSKLKAEDNDTMVRTFTRVAKDEK
jgi:uncharacterized protein (TIGR03067 family)